MLKSLRKTFPSMLNYSNQMKAVLSKITATSLAGLVE